ncbi:methyltransferase [Streptacidiphilus monticola]|uniref:Methyltransferase n=1 Tax=Streptacidiphilus monticola TaxID=2161674 RepID=A0ABW1GDL8_9ACTN
MTLSKDEAKAHRQACQLLALRRELTEDEREFVLDNWHEAANPGRRLDGAFFTPGDLAFDLRLEIGGTRVLDLCAGIGRLAWAARDLWVRRWENQPPRELVCVERNPDYVAVGRKVLPEARWICADVLDLTAMAAELGRFDTVVANPPFGRIDRGGKNAPGYTGARFEFHVIAVAAQFGRRGVFLLPQTSAPFQLSGRNYHRRVPNRDCEQFTQATGIELHAGVGIDTTAYPDFRNTAVRTEVVVCDFPDRPLTPAPAPAVSAPAPARAPASTCPAPSSTRPAQPRASEQLDLFTA